MDISDEGLEKETAELLVYFDAVKGMIFKSLRSVRDAAMKESNSSVFIQDIERMAFCKGRDAERARLFSIIEPLVECPHCGSKLKFGANSKNGEKRGCYEKKCPAAVKFDYYYITLDALAWEWVDRIATTIEDKEGK